LTAVAALVLGAAVHVWGAAGPESLPDPQRRAAPARRRPPAPPRVDYAAFSHATPAHRRSCDACHAFPSANWKEARAGGDAFPDVTEFPRHAACLECHRKQFFASERPAPKICSVCHVAVTPRETARLPFPNPVEAFRGSPRAREFVSAFRVTFPHARHLEMLGRRSPAGGGPPIARVAYGPQDAAAAPAASAACATCHQLYRPQGDSGDAYATPPPKGFEDGFWLKKGTFMTSPEGHAKCFECHSLDSGLAPGPGDCAACHALADPAARARSDFAAEAAARMGVEDPFVL
jgi:hypothetical protein